MKLNNEQINFLHFITTAIVNTTLDTNYGDEQLISPLSFIV